MAGASDHPCVDCGRPAHHWSYDNSDPNEKLSARGWYSTKLDTYAPRWQGCHSKVDVSLRRIVRRRAAKAAADGLRTI